MDLYILGSAGTLGSSSPSAPVIVSPVAPVAAPVTVAAVVASYSGYNHVGCYSDAASRSLPTQLSLSTTTVDACLSLAKAKGFSLAGLENGAECWAGHYISTTSSKLAASACSMSCTGNRAQLCGGPNALNYYQFVGVLSNEPTILLSYKNWNFIDCHSETKVGRALVNRLTTATNTVQACLDAANLAGFSMAGLE